MQFNTYFLIDKLRSRTAMYTGKHTLSNVRTYIDAYSSAMHDVGYKDVGNPEFCGFHKWVAQKYGFQRYTVGYPEILLAVTLDIHPDNVKWETFDQNMTESLHHKSVSLFFDLVTEYKNA